MTYVEIDVYNKIEIFQSTVQLQAMFVSILQECDVKMEMSVIEGELFLGELFLQEQGSAEFLSKQITRGDRDVYLYRISHAKYFFLHIFYYS